MKKVTIERDRWSRGMLFDNALLVDQLMVESARKHAGPEDLLPKEGNMCCLGFICLALGYTVDQIKGVRMPYSVKGWNSNHGISMKLQGDAADINDNSQIDDLTREKRLQQLLEGKIELEFV